MMRDASGQVKDAQGKDITGNFIRKHCVKCRRFRKYMRDTERYTTGICGECWPWKNGVAPEEKDLNI